MTIILLSFLLPFIVLFGLILGPMLYVRQKINLIIKRQVDARTEAIRLETERRIKAIEESKLRAAQAEKAREEHAQKLKEIEQQRHEKNRILAEKKLKQAEEEKQAIMAEFELLDKETQEKITLAAGNNAELFVKKFKYFKSKKQVQTIEKIEPMNSDEILVNARLKEHGIQSLKKWKKSF